LNRTIEWKHDEFHLDSDSRNAEIIVKCLEPENALPLSAPMESIRPKDVTDEDVKELNGQGTGSYRAIAARGNYLSGDRSEIRYAVKDLARRMATPRDIDHMQPIHFGRYLRGKMRAVNKYGYQKQCKSVDAWSDTDHAGCLEMPKSTTGGAIMFGHHDIKHWSSTQSLIALTSVEAEIMDASEQDHMR